MVVYFLTIRKIQYVPTQQGEHSCKCTEMSPTGRALMQMYRDVPNRESTHANVQRCPSNYKRELNCVIGLV